ncbi:uncharacterized protein LOC126416829 [Schistocerca serialis cubense]|uniref:uncharacterized protein LOC126416829 n=1 Tax=Schistocerca serialis cubense TaxID=2023355 RepID=UPI00214F2390|nr:uncharacterized protein LOC126416829 [Schistocerca serialis cubense]
MSIQLCQAFPVNVYNRFKKIHLRLHKTIQHIKFNRTCKKNDLIPSYINVKVKNSSTVAQKSKSFAERYWLLHEIKMLYSKKHHLNMMLYETHLELAKNVGNAAVFMALVEKTEHNTYIAMKHLQNKHKHKIMKLTVKKTQKYIYILNVKPHEHQHSFHPRLVNLTETELHENEKMLLEKGLKHCTNSKVNNQYIENLIVETEHILTREEQQNNCEINIGLTRELVKEEIKGIIKQTQQTHNKNNQTEAATMKRLKQKLTNNNVLITRADKGNVTVLMDKEQYITKTKEYINTNAIQKLKSDPTTRFQANVKRTLKNIEHTLTDKQKYYLTQKNPQAPTLRSQPKIHKDGMPMRPVINFKKAPTYRIAKHLQKLVTKHYKVENNRTLINTGNLIENIQNIQVPHTASLISFDIENMYTSIPITETIEIIEQNLSSHSNLTTDAIKEITDMLRLTTEQNYFQFEEEYYLQTDGLPMGSPISGTLANIFISHLENQIFDKITTNESFKIIYWYRYVDDIICLIDEPSEKIDELHSEINKAHKNIKFTLEKEKENQINFLDITIKKENGKHTFNIFRKPTATDTIIHSTSNHPQSQKFAALRHMLHRLNRFPLSKRNYEQEMNTIIQIARNNGYDTHVVHRLNQKIKTQIKNKHNISTIQKNSQDENLQTHSTNTHNDNTTQKRTRWYTMTYTHKLTHRVANILKRQGFKIAYKPGQTLQSHLITLDRIKPVFPQNENERRQKNQQQEVFLYPMNTSMN